MGEDEGPSPLSVPPDPPRQRGQGVEGTSHGRVDMSAMPAMSPSSAGFGRLGHRISSGASVGSAMASSAGLRSLPLPVQARSRCGTRGKDHGHDGEQAQNGDTFHDLSYLGQWYVVDRCCAFGDTDHKQVLFMVVHSL
ncbi:MAG: hypothetical protein R2838_22195 [Caldilineaceae bacterium]